MKKRKNIFKHLVGVNAKSSHISLMKHSKNERWLFGVLPADKEAPNVEDEKPENRFYGFFTVVAFLFLTKLLALSRLIPGTESFKMSI